MNAPPTTNGQAQDPAAAAAAPQQPPQVNVEVLRQQIDHVRRRTIPYDQQMHQMLQHADAACGLIDWLQKELSAAWADGDMIAWREYAKAALQAIATMTGVKENAGALMPAIESAGDSADAPKVAFGKIARMASEYADHMIEVDRQKRREIGQ